ncbi:MAG: hypothetical protein L0229_30920 [Blastocatellia bacterium]|nr:hypothetical protein [Blastocatellia bacterium]
MKDENQSRVSGSSFILHPSSFTELRGVIVALLIFAFAGLAHAQKVVDQILVLVNDGVITRTDLLWSLALDPDAPSLEGNIGSDLLRLKLEVMIEYRLVQQEAARIPAAEIPQEEIDRERNKLIAEFASEAAFRRRVEAVGLTSEKINDLVRERITINRFVDFRFRSFVFVTDQEIKKYYEENLAPEIRRAGQVPPPLDESDIRQRITETLRQQKINEELDRWLREARQRADIVILAEP